VFRLIVLLLSSIWLAAAAVAEEVVDAASLAKLEGAAGWPVVDVRDLSERSRAPIPGALEFGPGLNVSGPVLVLASEESIAQLTAVAIESRLPSAQAYAVSGGIDTLRTIRSDLLPSLGDSNMPGTFTIPSDTCQPGPALHTFTEEKK
jgi:rhodanese-related sulfurtransferase